jgi:hypothetical protein
LKKEDSLNPQSAIRNPQSENPPPLISHAMGWGVMVKSLTTMIGFGSLMISTERGLVSLGLLLAMGVGWAMVTALIVLPALLQMIGRPGSEEEEAPVILRSTPAYGDGRGEGSRYRAAS